MPHYCSKGIGRMRLQSHYKSNMEVCTVSNTVDSQKGIFACRTQYYLFQDKPKTNCHFTGVIHCVRTKYIYFKCCYSKVPWKSCFALLQIQKTSYQHCHCTKLYLQLNLHISNTNEHISRPQIKSDTEKQKLSTSGLQQVGRQAFI